MPPYPSLHCVNLPLDSSAYTVGQTIASPACCRSPLT
nr:MAG TPA: hypothetical protein [Caudoviricetes sp.]